MTIITYEEVVGVMQQAADRRSMTLEQFFASGQGDVHAVRLNRNLRAHFGNALFEEKLDDILDRSAE